MFALVRINMLILTEDVDILDVDLKEYFGFLIMVENLDAKLRVYIYYPL